MIVKFNDPKEFLEEMEKDRDEIDRRIVRLTTLRTPSKQVHSIYLYTVVATYRRGDEIVRLEKFCGDYWHDINTKGNEKTEQNIKATYEILEEGIRKLGLEVRGGTYEGI